MSEPVKEARRLAREAGAHVISGRPGHESTELMRKVSGLVKAVLLLCDELDHREARETGGETISAEDERIVNPMAMAFANTAVIFSLVKILERKGLLTDAELVARVKRDYLSDRPLPANGRGPLPDQQNLEEAQYALRVLLGLEDESAPLNP